MVVMGWWLDLMISEVFPNFNDIMILWHISHTYLYLVFFVSYHRILSLVMQS